MPAPSCKKEVQSFISMINYSPKFSARLSGLALLIRELSKDKVAFNWGPEHQAAFKLVKKDIAVVPILAYYDPKEDHSITNWCQYQWTWHLLATGWKTSIFCKQSPNRSPERICCHWALVPCCSLGYGKVSPLSAWQSLPTWNWPKALGNHPIKKLESGYTQIAKDTHQNISLQFQCVLLARFEEPTGRLLVQSRGTSRLYQAA